MKIKTEGETENLPGEKGEDQEGFSRDDSNKEGKRRSKR